MELYLELLYVLLMDLRYHCGREGDRLWEAEAEE